MFKGYEKWEGWEWGKGRGLRKGEKVYEVEQNCVPFQSARSHKLKNVSK